MRFAEQNKNHRVRMTFADLDDLRSGMAVASADPAQILARHAVETIESFAMISRGHQQFVKRGPVVSPVKVEADALAKAQRFAEPGYSSSMLYSPSPASASTLTSV